jgi:hypothetical protein
MSEHFEEARFKSKVDAALAKAKTVLDVNRKPTLPADVPHRYADKYLLAECVLNVAVAAEVTALQALGLSDALLKKALEWSRKGQAVTLRLKAEHRCEFDREVKREEEGNTEVVTKLVGVFKRTDKIITTIVEFFWNFSFEFELLLFPGNNAGDGIRLLTRAGKSEIKTSSKETPRPQVAIKDTLDLNLTWLLQHIDHETLGSRFSIERGHKDCRTPRRNRDVALALAFFQESRSWSSGVRSYFVDDLYGAQQPQDLDMTAINVASVFLPVVPLFEPASSKKKAASATPAIAGPAATAALPPGQKSPRVVKTGDEGGFGMLRSSLKAASKDLAVPYSAPAAAASDSPLLGEEDLDALLQEQKRSLEEKVASLGKVFAAGAKLVTVVEATVATVALHQETLAEAVFDGLNYVEEMLRKQIVAAIGKEVQPMDFAQYMLFHNRKLFKDEYRPKPFSHAVRRPQHCPEGVVSIEAQLADGSLSEPIQTIVSRSAIRTPLKFPIDAATTISFGGEVLLHGWLGHQFSGDSGLTLSLVARARQFSSFVLLIGRIAGPGVFDPTFGMIVKDKDELKVPLNLETIPSAKEFKEAISSLSAEQQRFAKAYRGMQLASTLFGICVIQIKPQLEKVLKLNNDSLTKEIELTQNLQELFLKYQIPSDLLSYDYTDGRPKVPAVVANVKTMLDLIEDAKKKEVKAAITQQKFNKAASVESSEEDKEEAEVVQVFRANANLRSKSSRQGGGGLVSRLANYFRSDSRDESSGAGPVLLSAPMSLSAAPQADDGVAASSNVPVAVAVEPTKPEPSHEEQPKAVAAVAGAETDDFSLVPKQIEARLEQYDEEGAVRPTIINAGLVFQKKSQANLLADLTESSLSTEEQRLEKQKCFDLLDALTKSGGLLVDDATLHIVMAASHCFDKSVINTLVQDNVNPIERVERSTLILGSVVHRVPFEELVKPSELERVKLYSSNLWK